jgi:hypothetical protein
MWADAARLATEQHSEYKLGDVWEDPVNRWLSQEVQPYDNKCLPIGNPYIRSDKPFRLAELLSGALNISPSHQTKAIEARAARVLKSLGYVNERCSIDGKQVRAWQKIRL